MTAAVSPSMIPVAGSAFVRPMTNGTGVRLYGSSSGYVGIKPAAAAGSVDYTLPSADGTSGQVLATNGSGVLSWATASGANPGGSGTELQYRSGASTFGAIAGSSYTTSPYGYGTQLSLGDVVINRSPTGNYHQYFPQVSLGPYNGILYQFSYPSLFHYVHNYYKVVTLTPSGQIGAYNENPTAMVDARAYDQDKVVFCARLASGQIANALEINGYGGSSGDKFKVTASGAVSLTTSLTMGSYGEIMSIGGVRVLSDGNSRIGIDYAGNGLQVANSRLIGITAGSTVDGTASAIAFGLHNTSTFEVNNGNLVANGGEFRDLRARNVILSTSTPASASATGTTGTVSWDADYVYVCTATNTWKRAALTTW